MNIWDTLQALEHENLTCLEHYFAFEALVWFSHNKKLEPPTASELALGARTYAKRFQEDGLVPFFIRRGAAHQMTFWARVKTLSPVERYLPRIP